MIIMRVIIIAIIIIIMIIILTCRDEQFLRSSGWSDWSLLWSREREERTERPSREWWWRMRRCSSW